jgi:hypothetical protein
MKRTICQCKRSLSEGALKSALSFSGCAARAQASDLYDCASHFELHAGDFFSELLRASSRVHLASGPTGLANQEYCRVSMIPVTTRHERVQAFNAMRKAHLHQELKRAVDGRRLGGDLTIEILEQVVRFGWAM